MQTKLRISLLSLRVTVFLVMFMWTLDKFIRPDHASIVFETFYFAPPVASLLMFAIGAVELLIICCFLVGIAKFWSYGFVLLFHFVSTVSAYNQYLAPYEEVNLLFFAAWPMLAACFTLFLLRKEDRLLSLNR